MTKQGLIQQTAKLAGTTQEQTRRVIDMALATVANALADGEQVKITGFGTFDAKQREKKNPGFHFAANEMIQSAEQHATYIAATFKPSDALKQRLNPIKEDSRQ